MRRRRAPRGTGLARATARSSREILRAALRPRSAVCAAKGRRSAARYVPDWETRPSTFPGEAHARNTVVTRAPERSARSRPVGSARRPCRTRPPAQGARPITGWTPRGCGADRTATDRSSRGARAPIIHATVPPIPMPATENEATPSARTTPITSFAICCRSQSPRVRSEVPKPRKSRANTREVDSARAGRTSRHAHQCSGKPCRRTSAWSMPSPMSATWNAAPPALTCRWVQGPSSSIALAGIRVFTCGPRPSLPSCGRAWSRRRPPGWWLRSKCAALPRRGRCGAPSGTRTPGR